MGRHPEDGRHDTVAPSKIHDVSHVVGGDDRGIMSVGVVHVNIAPRASAIVAEHLNMGVLALTRMRAAGVITKAEGWLPMVRRAGFTLPALLTFAVLFLSAGPKGGIRPFLEAFDKRTRSRLGALAGQRCIPTAASVSRALKGLKHADVRPFLDKLLAVSVGDVGILGHPSVCTFDAGGDPWHVVDIDPTIKAFRQRDLPEGPDMPPAVRIAPGRPGYVGKKRGSLRIRAIPTMHGGSALWLAMQLIEEEGSLVPVIRALVRTSVDTMSAHGVGADRVIIRGDAEHGSAGAMKAIVDTGASVLVRIARYDLLDREQVAAHMANMQWLPVRQTESGILREAGELGVFHLKGDTNDAEENVVKVRVVVTRFARTSKSRYGVVRGGFQYELFATTLDFSAWPAPDLVELYAERSALENRFAQEDREFGLGRTFSFSPAGQEWMWGIGLYLWNELICEGWKRNPPPAEKPTQQVRPTPAATEPSGAPRVDEFQPPTEPISETPAQVIRTTPPMTPIEARAALAKIVQRAFADVIAWGGWQFEPSTGDFRCPTGRRLFASSVTPHPGKPHRPRTTPRLAIRTEADACGGCSLRAGCYPTDRTSPSKQICRGITDGEHILVLQAFAALRTRLPPPTSPPTSMARLCPPKPNVAMYTPPAALVPGPWLFERPRFLPAAARRAVRDSARAATIELRVGRPERARQIKHPLLAENAEDRAHRRRQFRAAAAAHQCDRHVRVNIASSTPSTRESQERSP